MLKRSVPVKNPDIRPRPFWIGGSVCSLPLLTSLGLSYAATVKRAEPYNRLVQALPDMRADIITLVQQAIAQQRRAYVLVNNRSEGSAPLTIQALVDQRKGINMAVE